MEAKELLKQGLRWRIGNGEKVRVWGEAWLTTPYDFKILTKNLFLEHGMKVCDLLHPVTRTWKIHVLESLFENSSKSRLSHFRNRGHLFETNTPYTFY